MSKADARQDDVLRRVMEDLAPALEAARAQGLAPLGGPAVVQLIIRVEDATTVQAAVQQAILHVAREGFDQFVFGVHDTGTGEDYAVQAGQLLDIEAMRDSLQNDGPD